jgi:hypothetical protein
MADIIVGPLGSLAMELSKVGMMFNASADTAMPIAAQDMSRTKNFLICSVFLGFRQVQTGLERRAS